MSNLDKELSNTKTRDLFKKLLNLSDKNLDINFWTKRKNAHEKYLLEMKLEIEEVQEELNKSNNIAYVEDEAGDVLWDYLQFLKILERKGKIRSIEDVFKNCVEKYTQRIEALNSLEYRSWVEKNGMDSVPPMWNKVKAKQKRKLKQLNDKLNDEE